LRQPIAALGGRPSPYLNLDPQETSMNIASRSLRLLLVAGALATAAAPAGALASSHHAMMHHGKKHHAMKHAMKHPAMKHPAMKQ